MSECVYNFLVLPFIIGISFTIGRIFADIAIDILSNWMDERDERIRKERDRIDEEEFTASQKARHARTDKILKELFELIEQTDVVTTTTLEHSKEG